MTKVATAADVFRTGKLPHTEAEWLALGGVNEFYQEVAGLSIQCAVFQPARETKPSSGTVFVGGVPRDPAVRAKLPIVNKLFGYAAAGVAMDAKRPSYGFSFNWPGQGRSAGDILSTTIDSRTLFLTDLIHSLQKTYALDEVNLVGMNMGIVRLWPWNS